VQVDLYGNLGLTAISDVSEQGPRYSSNQVLFEIGAIFFFIPGTCFYGRTHIFELLTKPFATKQRLHDGVFIAALLANASEDDPKEQQQKQQPAEGEGAGEGGDEGAVAAGVDGGGDAGAGNRSSADGEEHVNEVGKELIAESAALMRRVPMSRVTLAVLDSSPRTGETNYMARGTMDAAAAFALSEGCGLGGCDFFVSHSWSDDARQKYAQMMAVTLLFQQRHHREPTFWLDKVCIEQTNIKRTLRCLPVLVSGAVPLLSDCLARDSDQILPAT
jgi:hypothetical protein